MNLVDKTILPVNCPTEPERPSVPSRCAPLRPPYERLLLAAIVTASALLYFWDLDSRPLSRYYSAAVRSMSESWPAFFTGAVDPGASITVDKIPGGFWPQALSARVFGFHPWSVMLPQALFAVVTLLVLHRAVRRHAGPLAALLATAALALTPVVAALSHVQWPDTLLTLLIVLAADAALRATASGSPRTLAVAGLWIGLAAHAKMLAAWGALPALAAAYLLAAPGTLRRRFGHVTLAGTATLAVSCLWLAAMWLIPEADRPYIDGTRDNNPFSMVVDYNGMDRFNGSGSKSAGTHAYRRGLFPTVFGLFGGQVMWLFPMALLAVVCGLVWRRHAERTDPERTGVVLWAVWLITFAAVFSVAQVNHAAYAVVLAPPLAALAGTGLALFWEAYRGGGARAWILPLAVLATAAWAIVLVRRVPDFRPWLTPAVAGAAALAVLLLALGLLVRTLPGPVVTAGALAAVVAVLLAPGTWTVSTRDPVYSGVVDNPAAGPLFADWKYVDAPPEVRRQLFAMAERFSGKDAQRELVSAQVLSPRDRDVVRYANSRRGGSRYALAVTDLVRASDLITGTGARVLPMGGFTGSIPFPTRNQLLGLLSDGDLRYVFVTAPTVPPAPGTTTPVGENAAWVAAHCAKVDPAAYTPDRAPSGDQLYDCGAATRSG